VLDGLDLELSPRPTVALVGAADRPPRALLAGAAVLVLDQPTARLDPRMASDLIEDVFSAAGNQTVFADHPSQPGLDRVDRVVSMAADEMTSSEIQT
jgi:ABC-type transport system involved in cytochrome bd biosynthesis fused ATPase/permease subunit